MIDPTSQIILFFGLIGFPFVAFTSLCGLLLVDVKMGEKGVAGLCRLVMLTHLATVLFGIYLFFAHGRVGLNVHLGHWYLAGHYHFDITLLLDRLSCPLLLMCSFLLNVIGYFCVQYLHRDKGYFRFCVLYLFFAGGITLVISAGTVDLLFAGWEVLGISSALLIGFYHERKGPALNGYYAFIYYRFCDVALLIGAVIWHHYAHTSKIPLAFSSIGTATHWELNATQFTLVSMIFIFASLAKSAQFPMSSWLPKAMEGPTPSSAIFYGALSIHAGAYLLLRLYPILEQSTMARGLIIVIGTVTALYGALVGRTRPDVKSMLAYAAMAQVGLIYVEIGLGLEALAIFHITGHSLVRTLQFLRSPSVLHDFQRMGHEPIMGSHLHIERLLPQGLRPWAYRQALAEGNLERILRLLIIRPFFGLSRFFVKVENSIFRSGSHQQESGNQSGL